MKIVAERDALLAALAATRRTVVKTVIPIMSNARLEASAGELSVLTHAFDQCMQAVIDVETEKPGACTAPAEMLHNIVRGMPAGSHLTISVDKAQLLIVCGKSRYRLPVLPAIDFPSALVAGKTIGECKFTPEDAARLFKQPMMAAETAESRFYLKGAYLHSIGGKLGTCVTDGHRLLRPETEIPFTGDGVIVPTVACQEIARLGADVDLTWSDRIIEARCGNLTYASKLVDGTFPDYHRAILPNYAGWIELDRAELAAAVDRLVALGAIHMVLTWGDDPTSVTLSITGAEAGQEEVDCSAEQMGAGHFGVSPRQLQDMVGVFTGETVRLHWIDKSSPCKFSDPADPGLLAIQMPRYSPAQEAAA